MSETHDLFTDASPAELNFLRRRAEFKLLEPHLQPTQNLDGYLFFGHTLSLLVVAMRLI